MVKTEYKLQSGNGEINPLENGKNSLEEKLQTYSFDEAFRTATEYFKGDELAAKAWINKYSLKDSHDNIYESSPDQMHHRLAKEIARIEKKYKNPMGEDKIYSLLKDFKYIVPQGSPMSGIGNDHQIVSLSNCFVIGNESDSYGGIMMTDQEQVQLMKRRGGVGHDLSHIRPKGSPVNNSALTSTGIVPFMERYSNSTREVAQDGRRGALMLSISSKHPDAEKFIDAKMDGTKVTGANVSVKIDDEFMNAVLQDKPYVQQFPINSDSPLVKKEVNAKELWNKIVHNAWKSAEPGVLFWDTIIRESVADCYANKGFKTVTTNPCGEIPLCPYDSCRLLAVNLYGFVENPFTDKAKFNWNKFKEYSGYAQRIMDDIIDLELEKIDKILDKVNSKDVEDENIKEVEKDLWMKIKNKTMKGRRTGVGVTAEGDTIAALSMRYGSDESIEFSTDIHKTLAIEAYRSSVNLANERGSFKIYDAEKEKDNPLIKRIKEADSELYQQMIKYGRRNISLLTIAPTGTVSLMTQTTSGIEPVFLPAYTRRRKVNPNDKDAKISFVDKVGDSWEEYKVFHHKFEDWLKIKGYDVEEIKKYNDKQLEEIVRQSPYFKATSNDVDWVAKIKLQGAVQKWVDHSISVTVNLPENISEEMVGKVYKEAWKAGCKGVTVYRDGSRSGVLISDKDKKLENKLRDEFPEERPRELEADVLRFKNVQNGKNEDWIAFVGLTESKKPYELFTGKTQDEVLAVPKSVEKGKIIKEKNENGSHYDFVFVDRNGFESKVGGISHQFDRANWNYARMISGMLRNGVPIVKVIDTISKLDEEVETINSWKSGAIRALTKYVEDGTRPKDHECGECGDLEGLVYEEGCLSCKNCGHSKCG